MTCVPGGIYSDESDDDADVIHVPDDPESQAVYHQHAVAVHAITATPSKSEQQPCIVCGGEHKFSGCPVLSEPEFLKQHYIRYCQQLRRDATARAQAFLGATGELPVKTTKKRVTTKKPKKSSQNLVDVTDATTSGDHPSDFQQGQTEVQKFGNPIRMNKMTAGRRQFS